MGFIKWLMSSITAAACGIGMYFLALSHDNIFVFIECSLFGIWFSCLMESKNE